MASKFGYRLTKRAESDLDGIVSYIAIDLANPQAASDFVDKLKDNIDEARVFPESGSLVDNEFLQVENLRKKLIGNYIMYYLPDTGEKIIYILRIIYSKQNITEILKNWIFNHVSIDHELIDAFIYRYRRRSIPLLCLLHTYRNNTIFFLYQKSVSYVQYILTSSVVISF